MKRFILAAVAVASLAGCGGQTEACKKYVACYDAAVPSAKGSLDAAYGPEGTCWKTNSAAADICNSFCETGNTSNATTYPDVAECK